MRIKGWVKSSWINDLDITFHTEKVRTAYDFKLLKALLIIETKPKKKKRGGRVG